MDEMVKVSVIVAVYNVGQYLEQFLESCINQTFKDTEIICVYRESTDNTYEVLQKYKEKDSRIKIVGQERNGLAAARNAGFKYAQGEYIYFSDSDDWLEPDLLEKAYKAITEKDADIVLFRGYDLYSDTKVKNNRRVPSFIKRYKTDTVKFEDNKNIIYQNPVSWAKMFKKEFITKNNLLFVEDARFAEDCVHWVSLINFNPKITLLDECLYNYRILREGSLTVDLQKDSMAQDEKVYETFKETDYYKNSSFENKMYIHDFFALAIISNYCNMPKLSLFFDYEKKLKNIINGYKEFGSLKPSIWKLLGFRLLKFRWVYIIGRRLVIHFLKAKNRMKYDKK